MMRFLALLPALLAAPALAQDGKCWIGYAGFEERVPHLDLDACPGNDPAPADGFCRIAIQGSEILVYVFRHEARAGEPCLERVERAEASAFLARHGLIQPRPPAR